MSLFDDLYGKKAEEPETGSLFADLYGEKSPEEILAERRRRLAELQANPPGEVDSDAKTAAKSILESLFIKTPMALGRGALLGGSNIVEGVQGLGQLAGEATGFDALTEAAKRGRGQQERYQQETLGMGDLSSGERIAANIAAQIPQLGGIGALGKVGQANKAVAALGALTGGSEFAGARAEGAGMAEAVTSAAVSGVAEAAFERYLGDVPVLKRILAGSGGLIETPKQALRYLGKNGGQEALEEVMTYVVQRAGQEATYMESYDKDVAAAFKRDVLGAAEAAGMGFGVGAGLTRLSMGRVGPKGTLTPAPAATPTEALLPPKPQDTLAEVTALKDGHVAELTSQGGWASLGLESAIADTEMRLKEIEELALEEERKRANEPLEIVSINDPSFSGLPDRSGAPAVSGQRPGGLFTKAQTETEELQGRYKRNKAGDIVPLTDPSFDPRFPSSGESIDLGAPSPLARTFPLELGNPLSLPEELVSLVPNPELSSRMVEEGSDKIDQTIKDVYDANAATAISQSDESTVDAVLSGDPGALGDQQTYLLQRSKLEERLLNLREEREKMRYGAAEAGKAAAYAVQNPAEARQALQAIRAHALANALETRDIEAFDRADEETRRRLEMYSGDADTGVPLARKTPGEAASAMRDVMIAALPKVEARANREYNRALKRGEQLGVDKQGYVQQAVLAFQKSMTQTFQSILSQTTGKPQSEILAKIDQTVRKLQKDFKIDLANVGYRGNAAMDYQGIIDSGAGWLKSKLTAVNDDLTRLSEAELAALARQARDEKAPVAAYDFIANELRRRIDGRPPRRIGIGQGNPEVHLQKVAKAIPEDVQVALYGPKLFDPPKTAGELRAHKLRKIIGRLRGQFDAQGQLSHNPYLAHLGVSIRDAGAHLLTKQARKILADRSLNVLSSTEAELHEREYEVASTLAAFDAKVREYVKEVNARTGATVSADEVQRLMYDAYTSENTQALPPALQSAIKDVMQPLLDKYTKVAMENIKDPEERATWEANMKRHLFRSYAIFHDPDASVKALNRESPAYQKFFVKQKAKNFEAFFEKAYADNIGTLKDAGYTEAEAQDLIGQMVDDRLHSQIESIVKGHVRTEGQREAGRLTSLIRKAQEVYREDRVLDDPDLREIMGEEKHMALAAQIGLNEIINDAYAITMRKGLMDLYRTHGLLGDTEAPGRTVKLNADTLEDFKGDETSVRAVYATPEVRDILNGIKMSNEVISKWVNRAVSYIKLGYVLNPGSFLQNVWNIPQTALISGGFTGLRRLNPSSLRWAKLIAREMSHPGSYLTLNQEDMTGLMREMGMTKESVQDAVKEMVALGLDTGGEWAIEFEQGVKALQYGAKPRSTRSKVTKQINRASELYRRPDLIVKVLAFQAHLEEAMWKEGVYTPTPAMSQEAARKALTTTQNPRTTPQIIRNMSRGAMGLLTFNFAGFTYQMNRNLAYGIKYAIQDAVHAKTLLGLANRAPSKVEAAELRAKAGRYGHAAANRAIGTGIAFAAMGTLYGNLIKAIANGLTGGDDEKDLQDMAPSIRHFRPYNEQTRSQITVLNHWRGKDGNIYSTVAEVGRVDIFDQTRQLLGALAGVPSANAPTQTLAPHERVLAVASILRQQYAALSGLSEAAYRAFKVKSKGGELTVELEDPLGAAETAFPTVLQTGASVVRSAKESATNPEVGMEDEGYARLVRILTRNTTGFPIRTINHNDDITRSYKRAWAEGSSFITPMRKEWKAAKTTEARIAVRTKYRKEWDKMMQGFSDDAEHAKGLGFKPGALKKLLDEQTQIPQYLTKKMALGVPVSLESYLGNIELE